MNEPTVVRTPASEMAWSDAAMTGWPRQAGRADATTMAREAGRFAPERTGVDCIDVGQGDVQSRAYARFSFNEKTGSVSIRIMDARTDEVIREIPPERVALIAEELQAFARRTVPGRRPADGVPHGAPHGAPVISAEGVDRYV